MAPNNMTQQYPCVANAESLINVNLPSKVDTVFYKADHSSDTGNCTSPPRRVDTIESKMFPSSNPPIFTHSTTQLPPSLEGNPYWNYPSQPTLYPTTNFYSAPPPYTPFNIPASSSPWGSFPPTPSPGGAGIVTNTLQILFSIQSVLFSLGQVVQIIGSNTSAIDHLHHQCNALFRSWMKWIQNISSGNFLLDSSTTGVSENKIIRVDDTEKRRRRLKAIRYGLMLSASFIGYRWVRMWYKKRSDYLRYLKFYQEMTYNVDANKKSN